MSTDTFEDTLRGLLRDSTDAEGPAYLDLDPEVVLVRGRRVVRRRRTAVGLGAAAVLAVAGLGAVTAGLGQDRAGETLPADPTVVRSVGPVTAVLDAFSDLSGPDGEPLDLPGPRQVAVTVDRAHAPDLVYSEVGPDGSLSALGGSSLAGLDPLASTWGTTDDGAQVLVGVMPEQATAFQLVTPMSDEGGHASTSVTEVLPGTGRTAFGVRFAEAADALAVRHLVWWGADGVVHDETGAVVPSVALGDPDGTTVFVAEAFDRMGTFSRGGGASMMTLDGAGNSSGRPVVSTARGIGDTMAGLFAAVVPDTATPGTFTAAPGTTVTQPLGKAGLPGTDLAVLWAQYTAPRIAAGSPYTAVTWTERGGTLVTERP